MKAKKLMGMIAFASACVSLSAFANTTNGWFGVTVESSNVSLSNISTNGIGDVEGDAIKLTDVAEDDPLVFTPTSGTVTNCTDDIYVIGASVALTPCSTNDFKEVDVSGAKAGVVVGFNENNETNYYGYAGGEWHKLIGATVVGPGEETTFYIVLNYRDTNTCFMISNTEDKWFGPYAMSAGETSALANIKAWGTGSISSVTGAFEVAVAAYGGKKYGSIAEAVANASSPGSVQAVDASGEIKDPGTPAANGLDLVICEAMGLPTDTTDDVATIKLGSSTTQSHSDKITLAWMKPPAAEDGVTIKFQVMKDGEEEGDPCEWDDIQIPMTSGTYTIEPVIVK